MLRLICHHSADTWQQKFRNSIFLVSEQLSAKERKAGEKRPLGHIFMRKDIGLSDTHNLEKVEIILKEIHFGKFLQEQHRGLSSARCKSFIIRIF